MRCKARICVFESSWLGKPLVSLKSLVLSRAAIMRDFRDFTLRRIVQQGHVLPPQENLILVGLRVPGCAGKAIIDNLCDLVKLALLKVEYGLKEKYEVLCVVPSDYSLVEEIKLAQRAKVIITVHGTISYLSLFTREGTQQISLASPKEYKENQILMWTTHSQLTYLSWDRLDELYSVLARSLKLSEVFFINKL
jgi:hypothetical protein